VYNKNKTVLHTYPAGKTGSFSIPNSITDIWDDAFSGCISLTSITIPNNVTSIGQEAFGNCTSLTSVTIPNSVTTIGSIAFYECTGLTSVTIGSGVINIGQGPFYRCINLTSITVDINNSKYTAENGILYNKDKTVLIAYPSVTGTFTIPKSVINIGDSVFESSSLTSITIPNNIISIGSYAFSNCISLTSVTFEGTIASTNFNSSTSFSGDLRAKFYATDPANGTPGTYTTTAPVDSSSVWNKQP